MASQPSEQLAPVPLEGEMEVDYEADAEEWELIQAVQDAQDLSDAHADFLALKSMNKEELNDHLQTQMTELQEAISALQVKEDPPAVALGAAPRRAMWNPEVQAPAGFCQRLKPSGSSNSAPLQAGPCEPRLLQQSFHPQLPGERALWHGRAVAGGFVFKVHEHALVDSSGDP